ncbi:MAG: SUMF1/EgtB/PvdO family nonheme iron enzyme, partial [Myxococcota bacterium]|nr:SUMF1/EgtB/PvdO family nonheme iron enzyme [Myxococcota bacterium]
MFRILFFCCFYLLSRPVHADVRIAVLDFRGTALDDSVLPILTSKVRAGILYASKGQSIRGESLVMMTRENTMLLLKDMGLDARACDGVCEVEIARNIGADYVVTGDVGQLGSLYVLSVKIHETTQGNLIADQSVETKRVEDLLTGSYDVGKSVFQEIQSKMPSSLGFTENRASDWTIKGAEEYIVSFQSHPSDAVVLVNEALLCKSTPCAKVLTKGEHRISIKKERHQSWEKSISITEESSVVAELEPSFGVIDVNPSIDGVQFLLDGRPLGQTPIVGHELDPGKHVLSVQDPCYTGPDYRLQIQAAQRKTISTYEIKPRVSGIKVRVYDKEENAVAASIFVDDVPVGRSPGTFVVPLCSKQLMAKLGEKSARTSLSLSEEQTEAISISFKEPSTVKAEGYDVVLVPSGRFMMGCSGEDCFKKEEPAVSVHLPKSFYMMTSEVTQGLYQRVMGQNPSHFYRCGTHCPVEQVSWYNAVAFANRLSVIEGRTPCYEQFGERVLWDDHQCNGWRLPTEAEWEYAARGGSGADIIYAGGHDLR